MTRLRTMAIQLLAVMAKEARQTRRDRRMMAVILVAPLVQLIVLGYAVNFDVDDVPTVVVDQDRTSASREHVGRLLADGTLTRAATLDSPQEAQRWLEDGQASVALVVPPGFARGLARGTPAEVQVLLDGSDPNRSAIAGGAAIQYFSVVAIDSLRERAAALGAALGRAVRMPMVEVSPRVFYNPRLRTAIYMVPGIACVLLLLVTTLVMSMGLAREREVGTLEQVLVTPISPGVLMVGKLLPFVAVGLFDVTLAITAGAWLFDLPLRGDLVYLLFATLCYLLTTLGIGLFVSTISRTQQQAFLGGFLVILPALLLSGTFTPIHSMPPWMQTLTLVNPVRYYIAIIRSVLLKDAGLRDLWPQTAALLVYGLVIITVAAVRFRKRL